MREKTTQLWLKAVLVLACTTFTNNANTAFRTTNTGQLSLLATIRGAPAFRPVLWRLLQKGQHQEVTIPRYSAVVDLVAGSYQISANMGSITKVEEVTIIAGGIHTLVINLQ